MPKHGQPTFVLGASAPMAEPVYRSGHRGSDPNQARPTPDAASAVRMRLGSFGVPTGLIEILRPGEVQSTVAFLKIRVESLLVSDLVV